jgi:signal transduction histidine kinase
MLVKDTFDVTPPLPYPCQQMAARQYSDWALEELGIRRVSLRVADVENAAALASAAETLGADSVVLATLLATAVEMGRARDPESGLVAFRESRDQVVVLSAAAVQSEGLLWASVAHELGNALTTIGGWASVASSTLDEKESRKAIAIVAESAREAMDIAPLLIEGEGDGESSEAGRVVAGVLERFAPVAAARGVALVSGRIDPGEVLASRAAVAAITANLVKNAIEACRDGGRVTVGVRTSNRAVEIVVEDDGRGMSEAVRRTLFSPRSSPREGSPAGRGVGLSVVQALVTRAGGKARVTSTVGAGSSVRIELRRLQKRGQSSGVRRRAGPRRVLVVEDDRSIAELVETTMIARGAVVFRTVSPDAALAEARRSSFDLALIDLDLGSTGGAGLVTQLVERELSGRVVVMSGAPNVDVPLAHGVLRKPFDLSDLADLLEQGPVPRRVRSR